MAAPRTADRAAPVRAPSLRRRLLIWLALLHLAALAATAWGAYVIYGRAIENLLDDQMRVLAESYAGHRHVPVLVALTPEALQARGALVVQLWSPDGSRLQAASSPVQVPMQAREGFADVRTGPAQADQWRVYTAPADAAHATLRVQVLQNHAFRHRRSIRRALAEGLPIALLLPAVLAVLWGIVWSASRSLRAVARDVAAQDEHAVGELPAERVPEEIRPMVDAFNTLLGRLRMALATQRHFVQDAAHELRTPVTAIALQVENLRPHIPPGEARERFALLEAGVARTRHLLDQLLSLSRQEAAGPATAVVQPVALAPLLRESIGQFADLADRRRIDLGWEVDATVAAASVPGSATELRSLFDNLIDNALRHTPEGSTVDVRLHAEAGHTVVDVDDNGPGIAGEALPRVFDRFFRAPGTAPGGSGLGLAIAQTAAARHGLRIELRNRTPAEGGPGLRARVHLPQRAA